MTKVLTGWAALLAQHDHDQAGLTDAEVIDFADQHSGTWP